MWVSRIWTSSSEASSGSATAAAVVIWASGANGRPWSGHSWRSEYQNKRKKRMQMPAQDQPDRSSSRMASSRGPHFLSCSGKLSFASCRCVLGSPEYRKVAHCLKFARDNETLTKRPVSFHHSSHGAPRACRVVRASLSCQSPSEPWSFRPPSLSSTAVWAASAQRSSQCSGYGKICKPGRVEISTPGIPGNFKHHPILTWVSLMLIDWFFLEFVCSHELHWITIRLTSFDHRCSKELCSTQAAMFWRAAWGKSIQLIPATGKIFFSQKTRRWSRTPGAPRPSSSSSLISAWLYSSDVNLGEFLDKSQWKLLTRSYSYCNSEALTKRTTPHLSNLKKASLCQGQNTSGSRLSRPPIRSAAIVRCIASSSQSCRQASMNTWTRNPNGHGSSCTPNTRAHYAPKMWRM